ncbi:hypothetical protein C0Q70_12419 [Pomacea canaliculata]|uniref:Uncharacterized protein n=1 Tax=Pomacea canaliculata TaxID=400727 RepID=A0A2T7P1H7_POMCA|nr:hypothetical protein C0Q70_12419 [Pomacea canaliculata]
MAKLPEKERGKKENGSPCTYGEAARERVREKEREKGRERERSLCKIRHLSPCVIASYWLADVSHKSSFWAISRWHKQATTTTTAAASFAGRIMHSHRLRPPVAGGRAESFVIGGSNFLHGFNAGSEMTSSEAANHQLEPPRVMSSAGHNNRHLASVCGHPGCQIAETAGQWPAFGMSVL